MKRNRIVLRIALLVAACIFGWLTVMSYRGVMTCWYEVCAYSDGTSYQDKLSAATSLIDLDQNSAKRFLLRARIRQKEIGIWCKCPESTKGYPTDEWYHSVIPEGCFDANQSGSLLNDARAAIADYTEVIKRDRSCEAYVERGQLRRLMKDYDGAIADFGAAISLDPGNRFCIAELRARTNMARRDYDSAVKDLSEVLKKKIDDDCLRECLRLRAMAYLAKGSYLQVITDLTSLMRSPGYKAKAWDYQTRGEAYAQFGKSALAKRDLEHAASLAHQGDAQ